MSSPTQEVLSQIVPSLLSAEMERGREGCKEGTENSAGGLPFRQHHLSYEKKMNLNKNVSQMSLCCQIHLCWLCSIWTSVCIFCEEI
jgi:hypothetical protein